MKMHGLLLLSCVLGCDAVIHAKGNMKNHTVAPIGLLSYDCPACCWYGRCEGAYQGQPGTCCTPGAAWGAEKCCPISKGYDVFKCQAVDVNDYHCANVGTGQPDAMTYKWGRENTNHCPQGYQRLTKSQCRDGDFPGVDGDVSVESADGYPGGCYQLSDDQVYFNTAKGSSASSAVPICGYAFFELSSVSLAEAAKTNMDSNAPVFIIMGAFLSSAVVFWGLKRRGGSASVSTAPLLG